MLKFLNTNSSVLNENIFSEKFAGKKVLVLGSGPSVNLVNWQNIEYDCIVTTTFFYLNDTIKSLKNITHVTLSEIIDFNDSRLHDFFKNNPNCTIALEPKLGRPFYSTEIFKKFEEQYRERLVYYNTEIDKKEGAAGRLTFFVMAFNPSELYYVGLDGKSKNHKNDPNNAFRVNIQGDADNYPYEEFVESHINMAKTLYKYSLHNNCKLYNLGEGFEFNCSTPYSQQYFPLNEKIKQKINNENK
jgi:hypothetical protein